MKQYEADIVIISAGTSGLAAAVAAAENGASVIAVERNARCGGNGNLAMGPFAVESRLQRLKQYTLTRGEAYRIHMEFTQWGVDARLVKSFIDRSADTLDWLEEMGVEFYDLASHGPGMNYTWHLIKPAPGDERRNTGYRAIEAMKKRADELGVGFLMKTTVKKLIKEDGKIVGALAEGTDGTIEVRGKAVICATGGYGAFWHPPMGIPLHGDGLNMAREAGADVSDGSILPAPGKPGQFPKKPERKTPCLNSCFGQPNLFVNMFGERFMDELVSAINPLGVNAINRQKDSTYFSIFDEAAKEYYIEHGLDFVQGYGTLVMGKPLEKPVNFDAELEQALAEGSDVIFAADSLDELAEKCAISAKSLKKTVAEYNLACETGRDLAFGKAAKYLRPVRGPRIYACKKIGGMFSGYTEGIKLSCRMEALTPEHEPIPGLYAAGIDAARNIWHNCYVNVLPGNAFGWALNSGRMAAENALEYIRKLP